MINVIYFDGINENKVSKILLSADNIRIRVQFEFENQRIISQSVSISIMGRLGIVDPSSYSEPERITTTHSSLRWNVDFNSTRLLGSVTHKFKLLDENVKLIVSEMLR